MENRNRNEKSMPEIKTDKMNNINTKKFILRSFLILILTVFINSSAAVNISDEVVKELERRQFETEKKLRDKERIVIGQEKNKENEQIIPKVDDGNKFFLNKIIIQNGELLSSREKRMLIEPYIGKEISFNDLTILVRSITNVLIDKGYITARVKVPLGQNIKSHEFTLTIVNGYISDLVPEKETLRNRIQVFTAFPFINDKYLNIEDLDYGLEQMNRLKSNNATMKICPGADLGSSKIVIFNESGNWFNLDIGYDNLGQEATGICRGKLSASIDDLLSINDNTSFDYTRSMNRDTDRKYSRSYAMFFSFPLGYWSFSSVYSCSEYMQNINGLNTDFKSSGIETSKIICLDRMLGRYKYNRFKTKSSFTLKNKENFIEDARIDTASRRLSIIKLGLDYSTYLFGGYFSSTAFYHRGLKFFDAYKDGKDLEDDAPKAQFNKFELDVLWNKPFSFLSQNFSYQLMFSGQYGMDTLYSSEKISIGDMNTVRGFKNDSIIGDRGFYIRNDFSMYDFSHLWRHLRGLKFIISYDYGYTVEKTGKDTNYGEGEGSVMGASAGIAYSSEIINMNVTYSRKLFSPWFVKENEHVIYCTATVSMSGLGSETWDFFTGHGYKKE